MRLWNEEGGRGRVCSIPIQVALFSLCVVRGYTISLSLSIISDCSLFFVRCSGLVLYFRVNVMIWPNPTITVCTLFLSQSPFLTLYFFLRSDSGRASQSVADDSHCLFCAFTWYLIGSVVSVVSFLCPIFWKLEKATAVCFAPYLSRHSQFEWFEFLDTQS